MKRLLALLRERHAVVWLATAVLVAVGIVLGLGLPSGIYPEVEFPRIVVVARTGGAPSDVFLTNVTRPLEQTLTTVLGVQRIRSKTIRGAGEISLQFLPDTDMWRALQLVESRVGEARSQLPADTEITVDRVTTGSFPVVTFNLSGAADPRELREIAEYVVRPALANVPGVGRIEVLGGDVREVEIVLDPEGTAALHLTSKDVADRLRQSMGLAAVGRVDRDRQIVTVLADALPKTLEDIRQMPVVQGADGVLVPLESIAEVVEGAEDRTVRVGGPHGETVSLSVARLPGASTPDVVDRAFATAAALRTSLPSGVTLTPVYDQAKLVQESMASVRDAIFLGILLCSVVIAIFLRDLRAGVVAALSVPITLAITFIAMRLAHQTLNLMSLGGMAVAIGLVVDDAIVMIEAIARHRDEGEDAPTASIHGTMELAPAVIGTTLTSVVVFLPLAFLQGLVGDFFRALAFALTTSVVVSLFVALGLVPLAASFGLSSRASRRSPGSGAAAFYDRLIRPVVRRPTLAALGFVLVLAVGVVVEPSVARGFLPTMDEGAFVLYYFLPAGTSLAVTEQFARKLESALRATPEVIDFTRRTGAELGPAAATQLNRGDIMVRLRSVRTRSADDVIADLRARLQQEAPEVRVEFVQVLQDVLNDLAGSPRPIEVKLLGPDYATLHALANGLADQLAHVPALVDLYNGDERNTPDLRIAVDRDAVARLGLAPDDVSSQLDTALHGSAVGSIRRFDRLIGVRVRLPNPVRFDPERVLDLPFLAKGEPTSLRAVTQAEFATSPSLLLHEALQPLVDVTADHEGNDLGAVTERVRALASAVKLPPGYRIELGGQMEGERETLRQLGLVGSAAVLLVLTVLASQLRRLRLAVLILGSVPMAIVGALVALWATATPLNASSLMGCVLLVGLVVKNGLLLLEEAEKRFDAGAAPHDAVAQASDRRLRPVVMTTVATLAGLFPLALRIGSGAELQRPLAIAVIGGLVTATIATLGLLPPFAALALRRRVP